MRIIPVLDLSRGVAVHARAGDRARYQPVRSALAPRSLGDPRALLQGYRERLGTRECYLADLDAIQGESPQLELIEELAPLAGMLLVDGAVTEPEMAQALLRRGATRVIVGLETLRGVGDLAAVVTAVGGDRVVFSLDLRHGRPVVQAGLQALAASDAESLAVRAVEAGAGAVLVLDLGRVGTGGGVDLRLLTVLRRAVGSTELLAGGGVRTRRDLDRMRDVGCDGVLVASALHAGEIDAADVAALEADPQSDANASQ
ncbi:MAG TPA: HisA/HisF-related TIM barrel protein [Gemmatimonadales bacterium]|nr:HisA/HisF-related TIM barrel protein [Gemmatimonadales bacterium]